MVRFLARRLLLAAPIIFGVLLFTFLLVRVGSNDPVGLLAGPTASAEEVAAIRRDLKLDQPIFTQFAQFAWRVVQGDLGRSWLSGKPVFDELVERIVPTLELVLLGALLGALVGVPAGLHAALRPNRWFDHASRVLSLFGFGMPTIFLGLVAIFVFFYLLQWAPPPMGRVDLMITAPPHVTGSYFIDAILAGDWQAAHSAAGRLVLPVACVATVFAAPLVKQTRAIATDVLASDYVRYARAAGLPESALRGIVWRNSAVPIITYGATELTALFGVASVLELIFSWGGVSQFGLTAILKGDFAVVQGYVLVMSLIAVVIFAIVDLVVLAIEPRARESGHG
jgi:peptide/nickel transport system permease protein